MCEGFKKVMCTRLQIGIKSVSSLGSRFGSVPCGVCAECRAVKKNSWTFRLRVEFEALVKKGWQIGFCTLTYSDERIPRIPLYFCKDTSLKITPMCFSREHVNTFIKGLRNWCYRKYKMRLDSETGIDDRFRFMVCSEYGESTKRSHYHALFAIPPRCDARKFYEQIKKQWVHNGHVFPRYFEGGVDCHNYEHKPFLVDTVSSACAYCAKYCTKDLSYFGTVDLANYYKKVVDWDGREDLLSRYLPFHAQSRSFGLAWLQGLNDEQKLDYLSYGVSFVGDDRLRQLPQYLRNKILFVNYYRINSDGKRVCRKQANDFMRANYEKIFEQKVRFIEDKFAKWGNYRPRNLPQGLASGYRDFVGVYQRLKSCSTKHIRNYIAFGGVWPSHCVNISRSRFWLSRYLCYDDGVNIYDVVFTCYDGNGCIVDCPTIDADYLGVLNWFFSYGNQLENYFNKVSNLLRIQEERRVQRIREYYKHSA